MFSVSSNPMRLAVMLTDHAGSEKFKMAASKLHCVHHLVTRMRSNQLQSNSTKTELLWCVSMRRQHRIPNAPIAVGSDNITPVRSVRNLGIYNDSDVSMQTHVVKTLSSCFTILCRIRSLRQSVSSSILKSLVVLLVLPRMDYGSVTLAGLHVSGSTYFNSS